VTELDKLRNSHGLAARLLRAGAREEPSRATRQRAERALGLAGVAAGVLWSSKASATIAGAGVEPGVRVAVPLFVKWLAFGMLAGGAALGGASAVRDALEAPAASATTRAPSRALNSEIARAREVQGRGVAVSEPAAASSADERPVNGAPNAQLEPARTGSSSAAVTLPLPEVDDDLPAASGDARLSHEIELLEQVRAKLRANKSGEALAELDSIRSEIQTLQTEADLLSVEALLAHGERARAEALAEELRRHGGGQNFRLKRLFGRP